MSFHPLDHGMVNSIDGRLFRERERIRGYSKKKV